jgi:hypothetical protein
MGGERYVTDNANNLTVKHRRHPKARIPDENALVYAGGGNQPLDAVLN